MMILWMQIQTIPTNPLTGLRQMNKMGELFPKS